MNRLLPTLLVLCACTSGDEGPVMASRDGAYRVVFAAEAHWKQGRARAEMESALARFPDIDLVYAHNDDMAYGAWTAADQAGRSDDILFVGIDALPDVGLRYVRQGILDVTLEYPTCGAAAVDLALLAIHQVELPAEIEYGTRVYTTDNVEDGGREVAGHGAEDLARLREEHADILTTEPMTDESWQIGMAQCTTDEPWRVQMNEDIRAAADRYPQIEIDIQSAGDDTARQRELIREFVVKNYAAILVSPKESGSLVAAAREAMEAGIPVIVIDRRLGGTEDDSTCFVGGDNLVIGRAAGREIKRLLGGKGRIVELRGLMTSSPGQERHRGFVESLDLR